MTVKYCKGYVNVFIGDNFDDIVYDFIKTQFKKLYP